MYSLLAATALLAASPTTLPQIPRGSDDELRANVVQRWMEPSGLAPCVDGFLPLGWSTSGLFAYLDYPDDLVRDECNGTAVVSVRDVTKGSTVWKREFRDVAEKLTCRRWEDAWLTQDREIGHELRRRGIDVARPPTLDPITREGGLRIDVRTTKADAAYELTVDTGKGPRPIERVTRRDKETSAKPRWYSTSPEYPLAIPVGSFRAPSGSWVAILLAERFPGAPHDCVEAGHARFRIVGFDPGAAKP